MFDSKCSHWSISNEIIWSIKFQFNSNFFKLFFFMKKFIPLGIIVFCKFILLFWILIPFAKEFTPFQKNALRSAFIGVSFLKKKIKSKINSTPFIELEILFYKNYRYRYSSKVTFIDRMIQPNESLTFATWDLPHSIFVGKYFFKIDSSTFDSKNLW